MTATSSAQPSWITRERVALAGLLAFALVVRGGVLWVMREKLQDDPDAYRRIAENLLADGVFAMGDGDNPQPTAYRPPLYPVVLSNLAAADRAHVSLGKVAGLHLLLGVGTVGLTWLTARRFVGWAVPTTPEAQPAATSWWAQPTLLMPLVAGVIVACDPILLNQSALVMTETLAAFLAILALWCLARFDSQRSWFNAALAGGALGLAILCRPTFLPWLGLVGIGMLLVRGRIENFKLKNANFKLRRTEVGWRVVNCAALVGVAALVVSPWVIRNHRVFGKPIVTTTHGGYTLWLGNNDSFYDWLRSDVSGIPWTHERIVGLSIDAWLHVFGEFSDGESVPRELAEDRLYYAEARATIQDNRSTFVKACFYRVGQLWSPLPNKLSAEESTGRRLLRYAVAVWYCGVYLLTAVGIWRLRWQLCSARVSDPAETADRRSPGGAGQGDLRSGASAGSGDPRTTRGIWRLRWKVFQPPWVWGVLLCLVFTGVHTFYWSNLRMRAPLMPFVALVAAAALCSRQGAAADRSPK